MVVWNSMLPKLLTFSWMLLSNMFVSFMKRYTTGIFDSNKF